MGLAGVPLLLTVCWLGTAGAAAAGGKVLSPPSNLSYSFVQICTLNWTWNPPENVGSSCDLEYSSEVVIGEVPQDTRAWSKSRSRVTETCLSEELRFRVRSECKHDNTTQPSSWLETSLLPKGVPGTAAANLSCVWHNLESMVCTWCAGENASRDTNYTLSYWFDGLNGSKECRNYFMHQGLYGCTFNLSFPNITRSYPVVRILIRDHSEEIRPVCASKNPTTIVKPATPGQLTLSNVKDEIHVEWSESETFPENCLVYEVQYHTGDLTTAQIIQVESSYMSVPSVDPKSKYTFKVRASPKPECYSSHLYSDWSEEKSIGEKQHSCNLLHLVYFCEKMDSTFPLALLITLPLTVAVSTIILLVYLKRLQILILPPIPDPREILKRMFGEQNEDPQSCAKDDSLNTCDRFIKEEEIHSLIVTETPVCANADKET
ncbi:interleukin-13 receptor subunit alpha-1-like isoform X1 [Melanerpes formicivorus]|uniref:interleukin-13 receptor subunit alpha-1-like isoform X1 n=1 Tax=Melanerpes formicivorus TaxID=211600 RepID=UPI00358FB039